MVDTSKGDLLAIPALIPEPYDTNANSRLFLWLNWQQVSKMNSYVAPARDPGAT